MSHAPSTEPWPWVRVERRGAGGGQLLQHVSDPRKWMVVVFIGRDGKGKRKDRKEVLTGTKKQAEARIVELLQEKNTGKLTPRSTITLADFVKEWLAHKEGKITARTLANGRQYLALYVLPTLGNRKLSDLTLREIDHLYAAMQTGKLPAPDNTPRWSGKPLAPATIRMAHGALSEALSQAVKWGMLPFNPASEATLPKGESREKRALSAQERARFIAASEGALHRVFYRVLMDTGMRPGEACALKWEDIDFANGRLTVSKATTQGKDGKPMLGPPKTAKSRRTLPLFNLGDLLLEHRAWQAERGLDACGHVFTTQDGRPLAPWTFGRRELDRILAAAGISGTFSLYSFRHTFATLHLESGTPLKVVSGWLGHSNIQQTANTYMHVSPDVSEDWAAKHMAFLESTERAEIRPVN